MPTNAKTSAPKLRAIPLIEPIATAPTGFPQHGGAREGAGRKPKALKYASELAQAEGKIIAALPEVIEALIKAAKGDEVTPSDVGAAKYLLDRVWGKIPPQGVPIAEDKALPLDPEKWEEEREIEEREADLMRDLRRGMLI